MRPRAYFEGQILAEHADGSPCRQNGPRRHRQRPRDPNCPGRARYVARCNWCGWTDQNPAKAPLIWQTRIHAAACDGWTVWAPIDPGTEPTTEPP